MTAVFLISSLRIKILGFLPSRRTVKIFRHGFLYFIFNFNFFPYLKFIFLSTRRRRKYWEFFLAVSLMLTILASLNLSLILAKLNKIVTVVIIILIVIFTIPSWVNFVSFYLQAIIFLRFTVFLRPKLSLRLFKKHSPKRQYVIIN